MVTQCLHLIIRSTPPYQYETLIFPIFSFIEQVFCQQTFYTFFIIIMASPVYKLKIIPWEHYIGKKGSLSVTPDWNLPLCKISSKSVQYFLSQFVTNIFTHIKIFPIYDAEDCIDELKWNHHINVHTASHQALQTLVLLELAFYDVSVQSKVSLFWFCIA